MSGINCREDTTAPPSEAEIRNSERWRIWNAIFDWQAKEQDTRTVLVLSNVLDVIREGKPK